MIEIKKEVQIGDSILEKGDKVQVLPKNTKKIKEFGDFGEEPVGDLTFRDAAIKIKDGEITSVTVHGLWRDSSLTLQNMMFRCRLVGPSILIWDSPRRGEAQIFKKDVANIEYTPGSITFTIRRQGAITVNFIEK